MGNLPSNIFCPSEAQRQYNAKSQLGHTGKHVRPSVPPPGMPQLVSASQHGSSTGEDTHRLASVQDSAHFFNDSRNDLGNFNPVAGLHARRWQSTRTATI
jgi:hypothetical protein